MKYIVILVSFAFFNPLFAADAKKIALEDLADLTEKYRAESGFAQQLFLAAKNGQDQWILELLDIEGISYYRFAIQDALHAAYDSGHIKTGKLIAETVYEKDNGLGAHLFGIGGYLIAIGIDVRADFYPKKLLNPLSKSPWSYSPEHSPRISDSNMLDPFECFEDG